MHLPPRARAPCPHAAHPPPPSDRRRILVVSCERQVTLLCQPRQVSMGRTIAVTPSKAVLTCRDASSLSEDPPSSKVASWSTVPRRTRARRRLGTLCSILRHSKQRAIRKMGLARRGDPPAPPSAEGSSRATWVSVKCHEQRPSLTPPDATPLTAATSFESSLAPAASDTIQDVASGHTKLSAPDLYSANLTPPWAPDPLMVGIRSPDGLVTPSALSIK